MSKIDFDAPAGIYGGTRKGARLQRLTFRRFPTLAEAIKHFVEETSGPRGFSYIELDEDRIDEAEIRRLYESAEFPLERRPGKPAE